MSPKRKEKSRNAMLTAARKLFWKYGIRKVTVEEICQEAGVSKMTFYRFFENKIELATLMLTEIYENALQDYNKIMQSDLTFPEKIRQTVLLKHQGTIDISEEFLNDVYQSDEPVFKELLTKYSELSRKSLRDDFTKAQKEGWIRKDLKIDFLMYMMNSIGERMFDEKLKAIFGNSHDLVMELTNFFFYGIGSADNTLNP
ncbi:MAG: TetR/AcrR family transcriptional regulator [Lentimicrobium sp.]|jgi:AcrR family transcriptional regulator|nr:TetR/AcrR family transcriptional regulator [Lentimicrobium sp.]